MSYRDLDLAVYDAPQLQAPPDEYRYRYRRTIWSPLLCDEEQIERMTRANDVIAGRASDQVTPPPGPPPRDAKLEQRI